jgi:uncharacterized membrane protein
MIPMKKLIQFTMALGILALLAGILGYLALVDIYHSEGDLSLEWNVLRLCALVLLVFIGSALATLGKLLKAL